MPIRAPEGYLDITNATLRASEIVTTSNVGIANANPTNTLSIGSNVFFEDTSSNAMTVRGNVVAEGIKLGFLQLLPSYDLELTANVGNSISNTVQFTNSTTGFITSSNVGIGTNAPDGLVDVGTVFKVKFGDSGATAADIITGYNSVGITESGGTYTYTRDTAANYGNFLPSTASYSPITGRRYRIKLTARSDFTGSIRLENPANGTVIASYDLTTSFTPYEWEFTATATTMYFRATITTGTTLQFNAFSMEVLEATANTDIIMGGTRFIKAHDATKNYVAIGPNAAHTSQGDYAVAAGFQAGYQNQGASTVAVGHDAGANSQGIYATAVGHNAGRDDQGTHAVAVGVNAGYTAQGIYSVAVGNSTGANSQGDYATAVGRLVGQYNQGSYATGLGNAAGRYNQGASTVAVGHDAGYDAQGDYAAAVGYAAGRNDQGASAVAMGNSAGNTSQGVQAVAVGHVAGRYNQGTQSTAVGYAAGNTSQGASAVAMGNSAGQQNQGVQAVAVGQLAGRYNQSTQSTAVGYNAGNTSQGESAVAMGRDAGQTAQGTQSTAVGVTAGETSQGFNATAVGVKAGRYNQGNSTTALGVSAGETSQGDNATAVGRRAGYQNQGTYSVAVGDQAGYTAQGTSAVAVGINAGATSQAANAVAVGNAAGQTAQGLYATAAGLSAGRYNQGESAVALGNNAGNTSQSINTVAVGFNSGRYNQGINGVAIGNEAGRTSQGVDAISIGRAAGRYNQSAEAIAMGYIAGDISQGAFAVAVGNSAGYTGQGQNAVAMGRSTGLTSQSDSAVAVGYAAGNTNQGSYATALGREAGQASQGAYAVAAGYTAGYTSQGANATAVGRDAGQTSQGIQSVAVGYGAGQHNQGTLSVAMGLGAGQTTQGDNATALGRQAGGLSQGGIATAVGYQAGRYNQGSWSTAVGGVAGETSQGIYATAVGYLAGNTGQGGYTLAMGRDAGRTSQGQFATAVGYNAGEELQGSYATAVGIGAGQKSQGYAAMAVGYAAGFQNSGIHAVAVGNFAGYNNQHQYSVVLNGTGTQLNTGASNSFYVKYLRAVGGSVMYYNTTTGEITYVTSDDRMKVKEVRIKDATKTLMKLSPQSYFKKFKLDEPDISHYESGLMAQDVWYDAPELRHAVHLGAYADPTPEKPPQPVPGDIEQDPDYSAWGSDPAQVQYDQLIPYTIKSIQEIVTELPRSKTTVSNAWGQNIVGLVVSANANAHKTNATPLVALSSTFMDKKWYGVISDKTTDTNDYDTLVDTKGDTQIWVTDVGGPLESGDLVTTSNIAPGFTQKQDSGALMNYTVAKVTQDCDFTEPTQRPIRVPKKEISNVTYYLQKTEVGVDLYEYEQNLCERRKTMKTETVYRKVHEEGLDTIYFDADGNEVSKRKYETLTGGSMVTYSDVSIDEYNALTPEEHTDYTETQKNVYYRVDIVESPVELEEGAYDETEVRQELVDVLDENGQIVWEETGETEPVYTLVDHGTYKAALVSAKLV